MNSCFVFGKDLLGYSLRPNLLIGYAEKIKPALEYLKANTDLSDNAIFEYGRFLLLKVMLRDTDDAESIRLSPSKPVEKVWLAHMIIPTNYTSTCLSLCQHVIAYHPQTAMDSKEKTQDRQLTTRQNYALYFGQEPPQDIWPTETVASLPIISNQDRQLTQEVCATETVASLPIVKTPSANSLSKFRRRASSKQDLALSQERKTSTETQTARDSNEKIQGHQLTTRPKIWSTKAVASLPITKAPSANSKRFERGNSRPPTHELSKFRGRVSSTREPVPRQESKTQPKRRITLLVTTTGRFEQTFAIPTILDTPVCGFYRFCRYDTGISDFRLIYDGRTLKHNSTLKLRDFGIEDYDVINLLPTPKSTSLISGGGGLYVNGIKVPSNYPRGRPLKLEIKMLT